MKVKIQQSYIYELLIAGTYFAANKQEALKQIFDEQDIKSIATKHQAFLAEMQKIPHSFIFLMDLLTDVPDKNDLTYFSNYLRQLSPIIIQDLLLASYYDDTNVSEILEENPQYLVNALCDFLLDVDQAISKKALDIPQAELAVANEWITKLVNEKGYLETLKILTGKPLDRFWVAETYLFVPTALEYAPVISDYHGRSEQLVTFPIGYAKPEELVISRERAVQTLKVLADQTRLEIIEMLLQKRYSGKELAEELKIRPASISHHIQQIRDCGMLYEFRNKNTKYFGINKRVLRQTQDYLENMKTGLTRKNS